MDARTRSGKMPVAMFLENTPGHQCLFRCLIGRLHSYSAGLLQNLTTVAPNSNHPRRGYHNRAQRALYRTRPLALTPHSGHIRGRCFCNAPFLYFFLPVGWSKPPFLYIHCERRLAPGCTRSFFDKNECAPLFLYNQAFDHLRKSLIAEIPL